MESPGYDVLLFESSWFLVKYRYRYVVSSLMDMAYRMSEQKLSKTRSLDYLSSPEFNFIFDLEDQFEEDETYTIREPTMEEYMTKTRDGYVLGIDRPKIDEKAQFELKDTQEVILFYKGLKVSTRQILDSKGAIPTMTAADARVAIQETAEHSKKWHDETSTRTKNTETSIGLDAI
nr:hypothetical protein [Tanacetum cinerariifolium]